MEQSKQKRRRAIFGCSAESCAFRLVLYFFLMFHLPPRWHSSYRSWGHGLDEYQSMEAEALEDSMNNQPLRFLASVSTLKCDKAIEIRVHILLSPSQAPPHSQSPRPWKLCLCLQDRYWFWGLYFQCIAYLLRMVLYSWTNLPSEKKDLEALPYWWHSIRVIGGLQTLSFRVQTWLAAQCQARWPRQLQLSIFVNYKNVCSTAAERSVHCCYKFQQPSPSGRTTANVVLN